MVDTFKEDFKRLEDKEKRLNEYLAERAMNQRTGRSTGKIDSTIKYELSDMEYYVKSIDKLTFLYQRHP